MIHALKSDRVVQALSVLISLTLLITISIWTMLIYGLFFRDMGNQAETAKATLQQHGFTIGEAIPDDELGTMRYPCVFDAGICTIKFDQQNKITEMGLVTTGDRGNEVIYETVIS